MAKSTFQQAMLVGIGLMVAIGFSGIFTYGSLINSGNTGNQNNNQQINATMPSENFIQDSYSLSLQQQAYLSINNQVVFVNVLYRDSRQNYTQLQTIPEQFNNTVYINAINMSESTFATNTGVEAPSALVIGNQPVRTQRGTLPYTVRRSKITQKAVISTICSVKRDITRFGATCY